MKASSRRSATRPSGPALLLGAILALSWTACTKDAESREATTATEATQTSAEAPAREGGQAAAEATQAGAARPAAKPVEAVPAGKTVGGDDSYTLQLDAPESVASGATGTVRVSVVPKTGWKMNKDFPTKLEVQAPEGVEVVKAAQRVADAERFDDGGATFAVQFKAATPGAKSFQAKFKFAVCTDATCDPKKQELAWVVDVK